LELRPTAARLRETLFNVLTAGNPEALEGSVWLDLYAGTGAVGIEAISRGANMVYFVESAGSAAELIKQNLTSLGIGVGFQIMRQDTIRALRALESAGAVADFVFLEGTYTLALSALAPSPVLKPETIVIAEHRKKFDPGEEFASLHRYRKLVQGDAALSFYRIIPAR
jgi:16S rRNA (guanine(966)-N(2))-methyltransferase RsmD